MHHLGIIGVGRMGLQQANAFARIRNCRIVAGAAPSVATRKKFAAAFPDAATYADHRDLLKDSRVDAIVVATPTHLHVTHTIDALRSGRPVLVEKPMARTVAQCRRMNAAAAASGGGGQLLMVAHCQRYSGNYETWAKLVRAGRIGSPVVWRFLKGGPGPTIPWFMDDKKGGGPLLDGAIHDQDFAISVFGDPVEVIASGIKLTPHTAVDTATGIITYTSGNQFMLSWSWAVPRAAIGFDILGPKGAIIYQREGDKTFYVLHDKKTGRQTAYPVKPSDQYLAQAKHFLDCIEGKATCRTPGTECIKAVASAQALIKASHSRTHRATVRF